MSGDIVDDFADCILMHHDVDECYDLLKTFVDDEEELRKLEEIARTTKLCWEKCDCDEFEYEAWAADEEDDEFCKKNCVCIE